MNVITNHTINATIALAALEEVVDPEIGLNVVDLGLIRQLDFDEPGKGIFVSMTLTTQFCPMGETLTGAVKRVIGRTFGDREVKVEPSFDPPWTADCISEQGRSFLNQ